MKRQLTAVAALVAAAATIATPATATADPVTVDGYAFRVLDEKLVDVDDLSGVDYQATTGRFTFVSDAAARVRTADLALGDTGFGHVRFAEGTRLRQADGSAFRQGGEAVRVDPADGSLLWANAGDRDLPRYGQPRLTSSTVRRSAVDGTFVTQHPAAPHTAASAEEQGIRDGLGIGGLTLNTGGTLAISAAAGPLVQDGPTPTSDAGAPVRVSFANRTTGSVLSQLAYELDPLRGNALTEILAVDASRYLVLERARLANGRHSVRLFEASTIGARSVLPFAALAGATYTPMRKRLLVDLGELDLARVGNLEGMTWGPALTSGERTLVLVSDNDCGGRTQLVALAVTLS